MGSSANVRPCAWISHNLGADKAKQLQDSGIRIVEELLFDERKKSSARQLDVVLERQTLKPCILSENTLLASNFSSARRSSRNVDPGQRNGNKRVGMVVQTPTPVKRRVPYSYSNSRNV